jgi:tryptophan 2,3-dioxygenase
MSYNNYLDPILNAQHPLSDAHDEMLFIQHRRRSCGCAQQLELEAARAAMLGGELPTALRC